MGANTTNGWFYLPALGASGQAELDLYDAGQEIADAQIEANRKNYPVMWSGLGMMTCSTTDTSQFDTYVDTLLANGFKEIRVEVQTWNAPTEVARVKAAVIRAVAKGADVIWGLDQWDGTPGYPAYPPITAANWSDYSDAMLAAAQWAQDNGVYEFQIGNEAGNEIDGTTMTYADLIPALKTLATAVQAVFTNGNVSYSCLSTYIPDWIAAGKGDLDILASNIYMGGSGSYDDSWMDDIDDLFAEFGASGTYLSEFAPSWSDIEDYSADEAVQAAAVTEMIDYIKASGMTRAIYFIYRGYTPTGSITDDFGAFDTDDTYRLLWNSLLGSELQGRIYIVGQTAGDILYYDGDNWVRLAKGTEGQVLTMGAAVPEWATP